MSWYEKHRPNSLDEILSNQEVVGYLRNMICSNKFSHFILSGESGSGKRTLIKIFLNTVSHKNNTLWLNHMSLKTIESKEKLQSFINSKTNMEHKWLVIENLHKMSIQFFYVLYSLLSSTSIIVCILESTHHIDLSSWAITFKMQVPSDDDLRRIAKTILKKEKKRYNTKLIDNFIISSDSKLCTFIFFLQIKYQKGVDITEHAYMPLSFSDVLYSKDLKTRVLEISKLEMLGYSHMDIAMQLYKHICHDTTKVEYSIELGETIEHLNHYEHDPYCLYSCICKLWKLHCKSSSTAVK